MDEGIDSNGLGSMTSICAHPPTSPTCSLTHSLSCCVSGTWRCRSSQQSSLHARFESDVSFHCSNTDAYSVCITVFIFRCACIQKLILRRLDLRQRLRSARIPQGRVQSNGSHSRGGGHPTKGTTHVVHALRWRGTATVCSQLQPRS